MKDLELLKKEQQELKAKLCEVIEYMNSEEYFTLNDARRKMLNNQRIAMEMYLRCLSIRIYEDLDSYSITIPDLGLMGTMMSMFTTPSYSVPIKPQLKESDFEEEEQ